MLGFQIPEKVNPEDFYMDVIGGLWKGSDESTSTLPERWEQYAAGNNAGAENTDCADGSRADPDEGLLHLLWNCSRETQIKVISDFQRY